MLRGIIFSHILSYPGDLKVYSPIFPLLLSRNLFGFVVQVEWIR